MMSELVVLEADSDNDGVGNIRGANRHGFAPATQHHVNGLHRGD
jgi:hypothetical protein